MATVSFTATFFSQTSTSPLLPDWSDIGTYIEATLSGTFPTETATLRGVYTFPGNIIVNSIYSTLTGSVLAGGATSASIDFNGTSYGPFSSSIGPVANFSPSYTVAGNVLTVDIALRSSPYTGSPAVARLDAQTVVVDYTEVPFVHNLGINF